MSRTERRHEGAGQMVSLAEYRVARQAAVFLSGAFHEPVAWLEGVTVEVADDGTVNIVVLLTTTDPMVARCIPTAVNHITVVQRVAE